MQARGIIYLVLSAVLYGLMPILAKEAYATGLGVMQVILIRSVVGSLIFGVAAGIGKRNLHVERKSVLPVIVAGVAFVLTWMTLYGSYVYVSSGVATSLHYLAPAIVALIVFLFMHERLGISRWMAVALCLVGVMLVSNPFGQEFSLPGVVLAVMSAVLYAITTVLIGTGRVKSLDPTVFSFYAYVIGIVLSLLAFPITGESITGNLSREGILYAIALSIFCTAIPTWLYVAGTQTIGPSRASIILTLEPVVALVAGIIVLGEGVYWYVIGGCALIVLGVVLVSRERASR